MTGVSVIVPFKAGVPKTRLSSLLTPAQRMEFSLLMLKDVLRTIGQAGLAPSCWVVSSDADALRCARISGCNPAEEKANRGVNAAVTTGMRQSKGRQFLVLPADIPLLSRSDMQEVLSVFAKIPGVVLSPSRTFDGTNLLLFTKDRPVSLSYDKNSFWNHLADAARRSCVVGIYTGTSVLHDVDTEVDFRALARPGINTPSAIFARKVLRKRASS